MSRVLALVLALCALVAPSVAQAQGRLNARVPARALVGVEPSAGSRVGSRDFLQRDPEGYADSVNVYAAMANDPINNRDPTGRTTGEFVAGYFLRAPLAIAKKVGPGLLVPLPVSAPLAFANDIKTFFEVAGKKGAGHGALAVLNNANPMSSAFDSGFQAADAVRAGDDTAAGSAAGETAFHAFTAVAMAYGGARGVTNALKFDFNLTGVLDGIAADQAAALSRSFQPPLRMGLGLLTSDYRGWAEGKGFKVWDEVGRGETMLQQLDDALERADELHFNTDGLQASRIRFGTEIEPYSGEPVVGWTNYELTRIMQSFRHKVRWWFDDIEDAALDPLPPKGPEQ